MAVSARRCAISSCERLSLRHQRNLRAAQGELRCQIKAWADSQLPASMYLSRVTIAEIRYGIERLPAAEGDWRRG
jgi:predicted nucleic acid-binding protein